MRDGSACRLLDHTAAWTALRRLRRGPDQTLLMDARRALPSVDGLLRHPALRPLLDCYARPAVTGLVRQALDVARREAVEGTPSVDALAERIVQDARRRWRSGPQPVINATGVVLHTNLGRAPLSR